MNRLALLIGGNQGDRQALIEEATALIAKRIGAVALASKVYETEPWGDFGDDHPAAFLNRALIVDTPLTPHEALRKALEIEATLGRQRPAESHCYHSRPMDIDLIFCNNDIIDSPDLQLPHPRAHLRRFVLEPLCELMPDYVHPVLGKTLKELLDAVE